MNDVTTLARNAPVPPKPLTAYEIRNWLDYELVGLIHRRDELLDALRASLDAYPRIDDDETQGEVGENRRMAETLLRTADTSRKMQKAPILEAGRALEAWFTAFEAPLAGPLSEMRARMDDYSARKLAASKAEAERRAREAQAAADAAAAKAAKLLEKTNRRKVTFIDPEAADRALAEAAEAAQAAERARTYADARPAEHVRTVGGYGANVSVRRTWGFRVTDLAAVPLAYLTVDERAVNAAKGMRDKNGRPVAVIPGIEWIATDVTMVR